MIPLLTLAVVLAAPGDGRSISAKEAVAIALQGEIGENDFRISDMGPDGDPDYSAYNPAIAYDDQYNSYLVVWSGDDDTGSLADDEFEIFGQRIDAATGDEIGSDFRLSDMGPDGDSNFDAYYPAAAYDDEYNRYLVVWQGDDDSGVMVDDEFEIFGQLIDAKTGDEIGGDARLSDMGPDGDPNYDANFPAIAYDDEYNRFLVVWTGDNNNDGQVQDEFEIFGQRLDAASGDEIGGDTRLSDMGPDGDGNYIAFRPAVAYDDEYNSYLVVWWGDDESGTLVDNEFEIFGQRVDAASGSEIGGDTRLSDMGPDGDGNYSAAEPAVAYDDEYNQFLVVWWGDDNSGGLVDGEFEIFGQRVDAASGSEIGGDTRLSDMGPDGDLDYSAFYPAVAYDDQYNSYLVVWWGDDDTGGLVDGELEIFGQRVDAASGSEIGSDTRLSDMGPDGDPNYRASGPAVAYDDQYNSFLVVWWGDDDTGGLVDGELEIFGQRYSVENSVYLPVIWRN
jgi:hypothetical protein